MKSVRLVNVHTARPTDVAKQANVAAFADWLGFNAARIDVSFETMFPTTSSSGDFSGIDAALEAFDAVGFEYFVLTVGVYSNVTDSTWTALQGTYLTTARPVKKRPPVAGNATLIAKAQLLFDHLATKCDALGIARGNVYIQVMQEPAFRGADGPRESSVLAHIAAQSLNGLWDQSSDWDNLAALYPGNGYENVQGLHEFLDYFWANISMPTGFRHYFPSFVCNGFLATDIQTETEVASFFNYRSFSWATKIIAANDVEVMPLSPHVYTSGLYQLGSLSPYNHAQVMARKNANFRGTVLSYVNHESITVPPIVWSNMEYGEEPVRLFNTATYANGEYTEALFGDFLGEMVSTFRDSVGDDTRNRSDFQTFDGFEELILDTFGSEDFCLINGSNQVRKAAIAVAAVNGVDISGDDPNDVVSGATWAASNFEPA